MNLEKFMRRVAISPDGCWLWTGATATNGYGRVSTGKTKREPAHRVSWRLHGRSVEAGMDLCHTCDVRCCVNPDHLFVGTRSQNMIDCRDKGRLRTPRLSGVEHSQARLTKEQVIEALTRVATGESQRAVARSLGVRREVIGFLVSGQTYKNLRQALNLDALLEEP